MIRSRQLLISLLLIFSWLLTWFILAPGSKGPFLFDDFPNLEKLGSFGPITSWELFRAFVFGGGAGPLGRPITLATFLLDANDWPADPAPFKRTNILIHILIGIILFPTIRKLLSSIGRSPAQANWTALVATTLWLFNPFLVSTTLYVIQRMTQLAALFSILGIWAYLQGRLWLFTRPVFGYINLSLSVGLFTLLAAYSKENGILLPFLILVIEFTLRYHWKKPEPDWRWQILFLGLPTLMILIYLATYLSGATRPLDIRNFTIAQRLLTEPRIILEYLFYLLFPHIQTRGLYQDGLSISTSIVSPWTTLPSVLGIILLVISGWWARRQWPLFSLATFFFLGGHLLESTTLPLELYFEHRNYLPSVFLFLPIATGIFGLWERNKLKLSLLISCIFCSGYALATWQCARLWSDENQLMLVWAKTNQLSARAQNSAVQTWIRLGNSDRALAHLETSLREIPDSALLTANYLSYKAHLGSLSPKEFAEGASRLRHQPFDAQILKALNYLVETLNANAPLPEYTVIMMDLLTSIRNDLQGRVPVAHRYTYYLQGLLLSGQGDGEGAYKYLNEELTFTKSLETSLHMVSLLATYHHFQQALRMLDQSQHLLQTQSDNSLRRQRSTYLDEIASLRLKLQKAIEDTKVQTGKISN